MVRVNTQINVNRRLKITGNQDAFLVLGILNLALSESMPLHREFSGVIQVAVAEPRRS